MAKSLAVQLSAAQAKVKYWAALTGATAKRWLKYWSNKVAYLFGIIETPGTPQIGDLPPTLNGAATAVLVGNNATVTWPAATRGSEAVSYYKLFRNSVQIGGNVAGLSYVDSLPPSTSASYTYMAFDALDRPSVLSPVSNTVGPTSGSLTPDNTPPDITGWLAPTLDAGGGANTTFRVSVATVSDTVVVGAQTSGMVGGAYPVYKDGNLIATRLAPSVSAAAILAAICQPGDTPPTVSYVAGAFSSSGDGEHYGPGDKYGLRAFTCISDVICDYTVSTLTPNPGQLYCKVGGEARQSLDWQSSYFNVFVCGATLPSNALQCYSEWRGGSGLQAQQVILGGATPTTISLPFRVRVVRLHNTYQAQYATNPASPSWQVLNEQAIDMGESIYGGLLMNKCSGTVTENGVTAATRVSCTSTGQQGQTPQMSFAARDAAGNTSAQGPAYGVVIDPPASTSGESLAYIYGIGGSQRRGQDVIRILGRLDRAILTLEPYNGSISYAATEAQAKAINPSYCQLPYMDSTRLDSSGLEALATAADMVVKDDNGNFALWTDGYGATKVFNYSSASLLWNPPRKDGAGRTAPVLEAEYRVDRDFSGGSASLANEGFPANPNNRGGYNDDVRPNPWYGPANFTPGNADAVVQMCTFFVQYLDTYRAKLEQKGVNSPVTSINASQFYGNIDPVKTTVMPIFSGKVDFPNFEHLASVLGGPWWGTNNVVDRFTNLLQPLIRAGGTGGMDADVDPPGYPDRARQIRFYACACFTLTDWKIGFKVNPEQYYRNFVDTFVEAECMDVDPSTGVGRAILTAGKMWAWMGDPVDPIQTAPQANGLVVRRRQHAMLIANPPDTGGTVMWTATVNGFFLNCSDDPTMNGGACVMGQQYPVPRMDGLIVAIP